MAAFDVLRSYLAARAQISADEFAFIEGLFTPRTLRAGEFLQHAGEPARHAAFVARGCLRSYVIDTKGVERIVQFAPEDWWLADIESLTTGAPSQYFFAAIEPSELLLIDPSSHQQLVDRVPGYAASLRTGIQRHSAAKDRRIVGALAASAEERYEEFMRTYPSVALRVPQWMLASYLGITPETVSRIRKRSSRRRSS